MEDLPELEEFPVLEFPQAKWQLKEDPEGLGISFSGLIERVCDELKSQTAMENRGVQQLLIETVEGTTYTIILTAKEGFFTVLVKKPKGWDPAIKDVLLLFSFKNLYLLGFWHKTKWMVFDDADLTGSGITNFEKLGFDGGYKGNSNDTKIGLTQIIEAMRVLTNNSKKRHNKKVWIALYIFIVVISEATRFPNWMNYLLKLFRSYSDDTVNGRGGNFLLDFTNWDKVSNRIQDGSCRFVPGNGYATWADLLSSLKVALKS